MMSEVTEELLMAYADGELDDVSRARVERAVAGSPKLERDLESHKEIRSRLNAHHDPILDREVPQRFRELLETNVVDLTAVRAKRTRPYLQQFSAIAATLAVGILTGHLLQGSSHSQLDASSGTILASGDLANALETQLASQQSPSAETRLGVSFAHKTVVCVELSTRPRWQALPVEQMAGGR